MWFSSDKHSTHIICWQWLGRKTVAGFPLTFERRNPKNSATVARAEPTHLNQSAYVFGDGLPTPPLTKLDDTRDLSVLYAKYWGVRSTRMSVNGWGAHGHLMENDHDDRSEVQVILGCFALNFHIKRFMVSKLWVCKDYYWQIYDHCQSCCESMLDVQSVHEFKLSK
jgi:hypothetical protein